MHRAAGRGQRRGYGLLGLLIAVACVLVLFVVLMTGLNKAVTGEGSVEVNTVRSVEDKVVLASMMQSLIANAAENKDRFLVPSVLCGTHDRSLDTTANFFSALVMGHHVRPEDLISGNEYSGYVEVDHDYDYTRYNPSAGVFWDPGFRADLKDLSNTSFAHLPMFGERFDRHWSATLGGTFPLLGNRGPKHGVNDPTSLTYGRKGRWAGHVVFGDGHVEFLETFTPPAIMFERNGRQRPDNIFAMDDGPKGRDAILSFTLSMGPEGPELQYD